MMDEEIFAENGEDIEGVHPKTLTQHSPAIVVSMFFSVVGIISSYGWFILFGTIICCYLWRNFRPKYEEWRETAEHHKNPDKFIAREVAVSAARQRMQEKYDQLANERAKKLQDQPADENAAQELSRPAAVCSQAQRKAFEDQDKQDKPKPKPKLRPAYNPMIGDTSSCTFRPGRRQTGGG